MAYDVVKNEMVHKLASHITKKLTVFKRTAFSVGLYAILLTGFLEPLKK